MTTRLSSQHCCFSRHHEDYGSYLITANGDDEQPKQQTLYHQADGVYSGGKTSRICLFVCLFVYLTLFKNKRAQRALERSPETEDFKKFPFFIAICTTGDTGRSKSEGYSFKI